MYLYPLWPFRDEKVIKSLHNWGTRRPLSILASFLKCLCYFFRSIWLSFLHTTYLKLCLCFWLMSISRAKRQKSTWFYKFFVLPYLPNRILLSSRKCQRSWGYLDGLSRLSKMEETGILTVRIWPVSSFPRLCTLELFSAKSKLRKHKDLELECGF